MPIVLELKKSDPLYDAKTSYYRRDLSVPHRRVRVCVSDNENTKLMLSLLRVIAADRDDLDMLMATAGSNLYRSIRDAQVAVTLRNELRAMKLLLAVCTHYLQSYPTTFEQDCQRLLYGNVEPFSNERHALIQVRGEKEVLLFFRDMSQVAIQLLQENDPGQFEALLESVRVSKDPIVYQYCRGTISRLHQDDLRKQQDYRRRNMDLSRPTIV